MKNPAYHNYLSSILEAIDEIKSFIGKMSYNKFAQDKTARTLTIQCIQIIAEATKHIPQNEKADNPNFPWEKIAALGDSIVLAYLELDVQSLYKTATETIPQLKTPIEKMLKSQP